GLPPNCSATVDRSASDTVMPSLFHEVVQGTNYVAVAVGILLSVGRFKCSNNSSITSVATSGSWANIGDRTLEQSGSERGVAMNDNEISSNIKIAVELVIAGIDELCASVENIDSIPFHRVHTNFERLEESLHRKTLLDAARSEEGRVGKHKD